MDDQPDPRLREWARQLRQIADDIHLGAGELKQIADEMDGGEGRKDEDDWPNNPGICGVDW